MAVDMAALAALLAAPPLRLLRAKGLMRDRDGRTRSLQLVGERSALAIGARNPQLGRLVCVALRGELQADRIRNALRPVPFDQTRCSTRCSMAISTRWSIGLVR